jgi:hypothetical protein
MHTNPQPEMNRKSKKNMEMGSGVLNAFLCAGEAWLEPPPLDWSSDPLRCGGFDSAPPSADCCLVHLAGSEIFFRLVPGIFYTVQHISALTLQNRHAFVPYLFKIICPVKLFYVPKRSIQFCDFDLVHWPLYRAV